METRNRHRIPVQIDDGRQPVFDPILTHAQGWLVTIFLGIIALTSVFAYGTDAVTQFVRLALGH